MQLYNLTKEIEFIRNKNITEFIKTQSITEKRYFGDKNEFIKYLYRCDLSEFLGLGKRFKCIFHDEDKASATIRYYRGEAYLYKCFGQCEKEKCYNIIGIVMEICEITYTKALKYLSELLYCELAFSLGEYGDVKEIVENNIDIVDRIEHKAADAYKIIHNDLKILYALLDEAAKVPTTVDGAITVSCSMRHLGRCANAQGSHISKTMAILAFFGLLKRIPNYAVPSEKFYKIADFSQRQEFPKFRLISQTKIERFDESTFELLERKAVEWDIYGFKKKDFTFKKVGSVAGAILANELFPQA